MFKPRTSSMGLRKATGRLKRPPAPMSHCSLRHGHLMPPHHQINARIISAGAGNSIFPFGSRERDRGGGNCLRIVSAGHVAWTFEANNGQCRTPKLPCLHVPTSFFGL